MLDRYRVAVGAYCYCYVSVAQAMTGKLNVNVVATQAVTLYDPVPADFTTDFLVFELSERVFIPDSLLVGAASGVRRHPSTKYPVKAIGLWRKHVDTTDPEYRNNVTIATY